MRRREHEDAYTVDVRDEDGRMVCRYDPDRDIVIVKQHGERTERRASLEDYRRKPKNG